MLEIFSESFICAANLPGLNPFMLSWASSLLPVPLWPQKHWAVTSFPCEGSIHWLLSILPGLCWAHNVFLTLMVGYFSEITGKLWACSFTVGFIYWETFLLIIIIFILFSFLGQEFKPISDRTFNHLTKDGIFYVQCVWRISEESAGGKARVCLPKLWMSLLYWLWEGLLVSSDNSWRSTDRSPDPASLGE